MNSIGFEQAKRNILKWTDKKVRYQNHVAFIATYLKIKTIPKGFKLKFHNNLNLDTSTILKNCSMKLMKRTISFYRKEITSLDTKIRVLMDSLDLEVVGEIQAMVSSKIQNVNEKAQ